MMNGRNRGMRLLIILAALAILPLAGQGQQATVTRRAPAPAVDPGQLAAGTPATPTDPAIGLSEAVARGDIATVRQLLDQGALVNTRDAQGRTPLLIAVEKKNPEMMRLLIELGGEPNGADRDGMTPLARAVATGQPALVKMMLEAGAKVNGPGPGGASPLAWTIQSAQLYENGGNVEPFKEIAKILVDYGADVNAPNANGQTPLHEAIRNRDLVEMLINFGAKPEVTNKAGFTPLYLAARNAPLETVAFMRGKGAQYTIHAAVELEDLAGIEKILKKNPAALNLPGPNGNTPLHLAARFPAVAKLLLARGADVNARNAVQETPLFCAVAEGNANVVAMLLDAGAKINDRERGGLTPLHRADNNADLDALALLLARGADPRAKDARGWTPLHFAAAVGDLAMVHALLAKDPTLAQGEQTPKPLADWAAENYKQSIESQLDNPDGPNASVLPRLARDRDLAQLKAVLDQQKDYIPASLLTAARFGSVEIAQFLATQGADVNAKDRLGKTPLHRAVEAERQDLVQWLLDHNAAPQTPDQYNQTPLTLAGQMGNTEIANLLRAHGATQ